jgi:hypothetical protein
MATSSSSAAYPPSIKRMRRAMRLRLTAPGAAMGVAGYALLPDQSVRTMGGVILLLLAAIFISGAEAIPRVVSDIRSAALTGGSPTTAPSDKAVMERIEAFTQRYPGAIHMAGHVLTPLVAAIVGAIVIVLVAVLAG